MEWSLRRIKRRQNNREEKRIPGNLIVDFDLPKNKNVSEIAVSVWRALMWVYSSS